MSETIKGKYLSLTSFKRDGTGVATPVWFAQENGSLFVKTDAESLKVKRIRHNPAVTIAACNASGKLRGEPAQARAEIVSGAEAQQGEELWDRKYRLDKIVILPIWRLAQRLRGHRESGEEVVLRITPS